MAAMAVVLPAHGPPVSKILVIFNLSSESLLTLLDLKLMPEESLLTKLREIESDNKKGIRSLKF